MRVVEKKDKHGAPLVIGFAEFETAHQAHAALKTLQASPSRSHLIHEAGQSR